MHRPANVVSLISNLLLSRNQAAPFVCQPSTTWFTTSTTGTSSSPEGFRWCKHGPSRDWENPSLHPMRGKFQQRRWTSTPGAHGLVVVSHTDSRQWGRAGSWCAPSSAPTSLAPVWILRIPRSGVGSRTHPPCLTRCHVRSFHCTAAASKEIDLQNCASVFPGQTYRYISSGLHLPFAGRLARPASC